LTKAARPSTDAVVTKVPDASGILRGINLNTKIQFLEGRNANGQRNSIYMNRNRGITLQAKLYVGSSDTNREKDLRSAFEFIGLDKALDSSSKIFVKPNFTFPRPTPGVTTSREVLEDTLRLLSESGVEVFVGESNGGYGSFLAAESFVGQGLHEICKRTRTEPVDLSRLETAEYVREIGGRQVSVRLPHLLAEEVNFTISVPVLKVHAMTTISLSMKNLWGCYPTDLRLLEHRELDRKLVLISKLIKARFGIVDARYGLDEHGPMEGTARWLGKFIAADNLLALDTTCGSMMGFQPEQIQHLRNMLEYSNGNAELPLVESNSDLSQYRWNFTVRRNAIDSLSFACFHNDLLAKMVFDSPFTNPIYAILGRKPRRKLV